MVREVHLVGVGMGNPATLTGEARQAIASSGLLVGAARLLEPFQDGGVPTASLVRTADIVKALRESDVPVASVLFSGDVGFYSGATALARELAGMPGVQVRSVAGVSSLQYFCARLLVPWQDAFAVSAHGRECDAVAAVRDHAKTFLLTGGKMRAQDVCAALASGGLGEAAVHVGERLSYEDERIVQGTAAQLAACIFGDMAVMLVENPLAEPSRPGRLVVR